MTTPAAESRNDEHRHLTAMDEMSLADEKSAQTAESDPDTLEVRDDSRAILHSTVNDLRRPLAIAAAVVGIAILVAAGLGALNRKPGPG